MSLERKKKLSRLKTVLIGDSGVGKTQIVNRFVNKRFSPAYREMVVVDFMTKMQEPAGFKVINQIWDTPGQEKFFTNEVFLPAPGAICIVININLSPAQQITSMRKWIERAKNQAPEAKLYFIGNRLDLAGDLLEERKKTFTDAVAMVNAELKKESESLDEYEDIPSFCCSAKRGNGIDQIFDSITKDFIRSTHPDLPIEGDDVSNSVDFFKNDTAPWERFKETESNHHTWIDGNALLISLTVVALVVLALIPPVAVVVFGVSFSGLALAGIAGGAALLLWNAVCGIKKWLGGDKGSLNLNADNLTETQVPLVVSSGEGGRQGLANNQEGENKDQTPQKEPQKKINQAPSSSVGLGKRE